MNKEIPKEIEQKMKPRRIQMSYSYALDGTEIFAIPTEYIIRYEQAWGRITPGQEDIDVGEATEALARMVMYETQTKIANADDVATAAAKLKDAGFGSISEFVLFKLLHFLSKKYKMCFNCCHFGLYDNECAVYWHLIQDDVMSPECFKMRER